MDSSVSPTHGEQELSAWNGHTNAPAIIRCFSSTSLATWNAARCFRHVHSADGWKAMLEPVVARYRGKVLRLPAEAALAMSEVYEFLEAEWISTRSACLPTRSSRSGSVISSSVQLDGQELDQAAPGDR
jgi:hypothetical protein